MARTARIRRGPAGTWSNRRWGLRADACGAGFCAVGVDVAPRWGGGAGPRWGWSSSVWRESACWRGSGRGRASRCGRPPPPRPLPAVGGCTDTGGGCRHSPPPGARWRSRVSPTAGSRASASASRAWEVPPGRWGYLPLERSREWGRVGAAAPCRRQVREHSRIAPTPVLAPRALRAVVPLGGRRVRRHPTGPHPRPLLTGPGSSNPGPPGGPGCPSRRAVRRSGRRAAPACHARRRVPRPGGQWSVPGRSPWRAPDRPFR
ncbi:hypothetical protein SUDANB148_01411 [Streptomyces sp. SudanB148_2056]